MVFALLAQLDAIAGGNVRPRADEEIIYGIEGRPSIKRGLGHGYVLDRAPVAKDFANDLFQVAHREG